MERNIVVSPRVFISYSWEDEKHKSWVKSLADSLINDGIDVSIDQYDLSLGDRLPQFMEQQITNADYVLIICTPTYKEKSDSRKGEVGYEGHIISGELFTLHNERKFIPIIRKGNRLSAIPTCLEGKLGVDLSGRGSYDDSYKDLVTTILGGKRKPEIGKKPDYVDKLPLSSQESQCLSQDEPIRILGIITDEVTMPRLNGIRGSALYKIPFRLSKTPSRLWGDLFVHEWNNPSRFTTMHRPRIASVNGDRIILNGTTIEEVRDYHRETLLLCIDEASKKERQILLEQKRLKEREEAQTREYNRTVRSIAEELEF